MAEEVREVEQVVSRTPDGNTVQKTQRISDTRGAGEHQRNVATRVIWFIAGIILTLLAFRFILSLLGANRNNGFADFIYSVSHPFAAPFFGLFNYQAEYGVSRFEIGTLVAMAVYAIVATGIAYLVTINSRERDNA